MKKLLSALFIASSVVAMAQPKGKDPKMAANLSPGYYCNLKGDTIKGEIQTNPTNGEADLYREFNFKPKGAGKVTAISNKKAKCYGFDGRHFTLIPFDADFAYVEYIAKGRLCFYEYKFLGSVAGQPGIESIYFIQDTKADQASIELRELKQISTKFYKKDIKPFYKEHPELWSDLDKFTFNKEAIANSIREFNRYYDTSSDAGKTQVETEKVTEDGNEVKE